PAFVRLLSAWVSGFEARFARPPRDNSRRVPCVLHSSRHTHPASPARTRVSSPALQNEIRRPAFRPGAASSCPQGRPHLRKRLLTEKRPIRHSPFRKRP